MLAFLSLIVWDLCIWTKFYHPVKKHEDAEYPDNGDNLIIRDLLPLINEGILMML